MNARPITVLSLVQILLIVIVFLLVCGFMKINGYPDGRPWPFLPLFVRENIYFLLLVCVAWTGFAVFASTRPTFFYNGMIILGVTFAVALAFLGIFAILIAIIGPPQPLMEIQ